MHCAHYIFPEKPWQKRVMSVESEGLYGTLHGWWWDQFNELGNDMKIIDLEGWHFVLSMVDTAH